MNLSLGYESAGSKSLGVERDVSSYRAEEYQQNPSSVASYQRHTMKKKEQAQSERREKDVGKQIAEKVPCLVPVLSERGEMATLAHMHLTDCMQT